MQQVLEVRRYSHSMKEALTLSPRVATLSAGSARKCCLPRLVSATTSSSSSSSSKGSRREDMVRHSSHVRRPQSSPILTHTGGIVMSCLRSLESSTSVHVLCWCAARQVAHSAAERSKCRYLQNLPGWHRHAAVAPPHEASPDMSGRRPCRALNSRTDRSRDVLPRNSQLSQHWTRLPLAPPSKELTTTWVLSWRTGGTLRWCSPTWLAVSVHSSRHRCSTQLRVSWQP